ncbi:organic hydroperoxide resistance protein [Shouchella shacheensis]|uniref:organic hydroperoxide resistance protein n=1 Tax=Shouchella shacheensis TaxID=1649580 RepID=UPI0007402251|nr:organic hydroperoxide resistance protein [Shouchella shacheensis]
MADIVYTSKATAQGGREGHVASDDKNIDIDLVKPGSKQEGTNPEQLFAAGYASCFDGALNLMASNANKEIESTTTAHVSLVKDPSDDGFQIGAELEVSIKGVSQDEAQDLVEKAHNFCPYSKATRGNIQVKLTAKAE